MGITTVIDNLELSFRQTSRYNIKLARRPDPWREDRCIVLSGMIDALPSGLDPMAVSIGPFAGCPVHGSNRHWTTSPVRLVTVLKYLGTDPQVVIGIECLPGDPSRAGDNAS